MLPNFVIIGAMKSGTTSLYHYLSLHPEIVMSEKKEIKFFVKEKNYWRGLEWYQSHFNPGETGISGEASTDYAKFPRFRGVPQRMHAVIPDAKLLYILRDPVERIVAHYVHYYANCRENRTFAEALAELDGNHYVEVSKYYMQLEQYLPYYSEENILILDSDELKNARQQTLRKVFRFLGVDPTFYAADYTKLFHASSVKKRKNRLGKYFLDRYFAAQYAPNPIAFQALERLKPYWPRQAISLYRRLTEYPFERPVLSAEQRERLSACLQSDVEALRRFTGIPFTGWCV